MLTKLLKYGAGIAATCFAAKKAYDIVQTRNNSLHNLGRKGEGKDSLATGSVDTGLNHIRGAEAKFSDSKAASFADDSFGVKETKTPAQDWRSSTDTDSEI